MTDPNAAHDPPPSWLAIALYPAQRASLTSLAAMAIAMPLTLLPMLGYLLQLVVWAAAYHYAVEVFRRSANGTFSAPEFTPNNYGIGGRLVVLQLAFSLAQWALQGYVEAGLPHALGMVLLALAQPAMTLTVAMNLNLASALRPLHVLRVTAAMGAGFVLLVLAGIGLNAMQACVGELTAAGRAWVLTVVAGIGLGDRTQVAAMFGGNGILAILVQMLAGFTWFYAVVAYFHAMGVLTHARARDLGFEPEPLRRLRPEDHHAPLLRRVDEMVAQQNLAAAAQALGECVATQLHVSPAMHARYRDLLRRMDDQAGLLAHAQQRVEALLAAGAEREAIAMTREALAIDPQFRPAAAMHTTRLAQAAERLGQPGLAIDLLHDFPTRHPRDAAIPDNALLAARLLSECRHDLGGALAAVQAALATMLPAHPRHAELVQERDRLQALAAASPPR